jgi:hypothetical protein
MICGDIKLPDRFFLEQIHDELQDQYGLIVLASLLNFPGGNHFPFFSGSQLK